MIDTLMVLWNRGYVGRALMALVTFLVICISTSLLLVTLYATWHYVPIPKNRQVVSNQVGTKPAQTNVGPEQTVVVIPSLTITAQSNTGEQASPTAVPTYSIITNPNPEHVCTVNVPTQITRHTTPTSVRSEVTVGPAGTGKTPQIPKERPVGTTWSGTATPEAVASPTLIPITHLKPTYLAPTGQAGSIDDPGVGKHEHHQHKGQRCCTNCLSDSVGVGDAPWLLAWLEIELWLVLGISSAGTLLFCGMMHALSQRRRTTSDLEGEPANRMTI